MARSLSIPAATTGYDLGLRQFFLQVLGLMCLGLAVTGGISLWISHDPATMSALFHLEPTVGEDGQTVMSPTMSGWWIAATILQLGMVLMLSGARLSRLGRGVGRGVFLAYASLTGVTIAPALYAYTDASVALVFFVTAATFGICAIVGHTTKINLQPLNTFFLMGLIGLLVAMVANIFFRLPAMDYVICGAGVLLFAGLTAFDMQRLKALYDEMGATDDLVVYGALALYLDFINMMLFFLRLIGIKRD